MIDTPRTDEVLQHADDCDVFVASARKLERELAGAQDYNRKLSDRCEALEAELAALKDRDVSTWWDNVKETGLAISHEDGWTILKTADLDAMCAGNQVDDANRVSWKALALWLASCQAATAEYDGQLCSTSKSRRGRFVSICFTALQAIRGEESVIRPITKDEVIERLEQVLAASGTTAKP